MLLRMLGAAPDGVKPRALVHVKANAAISAVAKKAEGEGLQADASKCVHAFGTHDLLGHYLPLYKMAALPHGKPCPVRACAVRNRTS